MYTTKGTVIAAAFTGRCATCQAVYSLSYYHTKDDFYQPDAKQLFFQTTSYTVFEIELLRQLTAQLTFSAASFESRAEVYNMVNGIRDQDRLASFASLHRRSNPHGHEDGLDWQLNVTRLEDGWFLHRLISTFADLGILNDINLSVTTVGNRKDIDYLCQRAMLISTSPPKWVQHSCKTPECKEGMVTIDGNEKLSRPMCAATKSKVLCPVNHINLVQCCSRSPIMGGKHQRASKFCGEHQHLDHAPAPPSL